MKYQQKSEIWCPVVGYEGMYEVSDAGRVRRVAPRRAGKPLSAGAVLKPAMQGSAHKYSAVSLLSDRSVRANAKIHRLVAAAFLGPCPDGLAVNHKDNDPTNNAVANLEYVTPRENRHHADRLGVTARGERVGTAIATAVAVTDIREQAALGVSQRCLARKHQLSQRTIGRIIHRKSWVHV